MTKQEIVYLHPAHTARALMLVYLCFSLPIVGLVFFTGFVRTGELPAIAILSGLILNALIGFGALWLGCHAYNWVAARFGGIEIALRDVPEEA
ncbi:hypothetical protein ACS7SF_03245 [Ralstonia sp. 25C]|uniref:hypothetical protein n=1 Tax=unclassified Ralstonia TaxID=209769 RepID=UPI003CEE7CBD